MQVQALQRSEVSAELMAQARMICHDALSVRQSQAFYATGEVCQDPGQGAVTLIKDGKVLELRQVLETVEMAAEIAQ